MFEHVKKWIKKDPPRAFFTFFVLAAHLSLISWLTFFFTPPAKRASKPMVIKTITARPPSLAKEKKMSASAATAPQPVQPKAKKPIAASASPSPKKPPAPAQKKAPPIADKQLDKTKKKNEPKKNLQEERDKLSQKLLKDLEESIAKIDEKPDKRSSSNKTALPKKFQPLQLDSLEETGEKEGVFQATLIDYLKQSLHLPDYGDVKVELTLRPDGSVAKLLVIKAESEKNREYLEAHLPHLRFPPIEGNKKEKTYVVTFCNEL